MQDLLKKYKDKAPEIVFEWHDSETEAKGWVVINSLRNGAAGGGTRMRSGVTREEVISLAKVMEIKFSVSGPPIGGAKSGIDFDPGDPRKNEVLKRWYKAIFPLLKNYYGTGGDLNVDELKEVIPMTEALGLWHPQEGVVRGHFDVRSGEAVKTLGQLRYGVAKIIENPLYVPDGPDKFAIADMITGYGVAESVMHFYNIFKRQDLKGKRVIIQGWGNVASAAAMYLVVYGAKIVGIIDRVGGLINEEGMGLEEIKQLFINKDGNKLRSSELIPFEEVNERIWDLKHEIFIPAAASKIVSREQTEKMIENGLEVISCGANVPFVDDKVFFGDTARWADEKVSLIPDFIANCGMARVFAYLMENEAELTDEAIFNDVSGVIREAINEVYSADKSITGFSTNALKIALEKLLN
jgi:glutamate dehydrogenase/leucine dehydrogenase